MEAIGLFLYMALYYNLYENFPVLIGYTTRELEKGVIVNTKVIPRDLKEIEEKLREYYFDLKLKRSLLLSEVIGVYYNRYEIEFVPKTPEMKLSERFDFVFRVRDHYDLKFHELELSNGPFIDFIYIWLIRGLNYIQFNKLVSKNMDSRLEILRYLTVYNIIWNKELHGYREALNLSREAYSWLRYYVESYFRSTDKCQFSYYKSDFYMMMSLLVVLPIHVFYVDVPVESRKLENISVFYLNGKVTVCTVDRNEEVRYQVGRISFKKAIKRMKSLPDSIMLFKYEDKYYILSGSDAVNDEERVKVSNMLDEWWDDASQLLHQNLNLFYFRTRFYLSFHRYQGVVESFWKSKGRDQFFVNFEISRQSIIDDFGSTYVDLISYSSYYIQKELQIFNLWDKELSRVRYKTELAIDLQVPDDRELTEEDFEFTKSHTVVTSVDVLAQRETMVKKLKESREQNDKSRYIFELNQRIVSLEDQLISRYYNQERLFSSYRSLQQEYRSLERRACRVEKLTSLQRRAYRYMHCIDQDSLSLNNDLVIRCFHNLSEIIRAEVCPVIEDLISRVENEYSIKSKVVKEGSVKRKEIACNVGSIKDDSQSIHNLILDKCVESSLVLNESKVSCEVQSVLNDISQRVESEFTVLDKSVDRMTQVEQDNMVNKIEGEFVGITATLVKKRKTYNSNIRKDRLKYIKECRIGDSSFYNCKHCETTNISNRILVRHYNRWLSEGTCVPKRIRRSIRV